jgi:hypothetical protein
MPKLYNDSVQDASEKIQWQRDDVATKIVDFEQAREKQSQRQFAIEQGVSRSTLQHWLARKDSIDASASLIEFFESPDGTALLHRIMTAAHFVFTKDGVASIHNVSSFLKLSGLSHFAASSYTTQQRVSKQMDESIIDFEKFVRPQLSQNMAVKKITLAEDETFHPQICAVAMEPVSNYIIVEKYVANREGGTWNQVVSEGLEGLPVQVIQVTSDQARGLINHTTKGLDAHHSSDCFHVTYEIGKGTSGALASAVKKAEKQYELCVKQTQKQVSKQQNYDNQSKRPVGRRPNFEKKIESAKEDQNQAQSKLEIAKQNQETVSNAKSEIGKIYHPFDVQTGAKQDSQKVNELLQSCFSDIKEAIEDLSDRCKQRVDKAHRVVKNMVATIAFFFSMVDVYMDNEQISARDRQLLHDYLIPGFYLERVAAKQKNADQKPLILQKARQLLSILTQPDGPFSEYSQQDVKRLQKVAKECAQIFQRSSSCVEGRNAQLSLRHHGIHKLSDRSLKAQTVIHNYYRRNRDGTTPAERFFEANHMDLFEWLLDKMDYPARPRKRTKAAV